MKLMVGDTGENREGDVGTNELGGVGGDFAGSLGFSRPTSSRTRSTVKLMDSRPMLVSRL